MLDKMFYVDTSKFAIFLEEDNPCNYSKFWHRPEHLFGGKKLNYDEMKKEVKYFGFHIQKVMAKFHQA